jgi:curved DNA-binding protein CbpA
VTYTDACVVLGIGPAFSDRDLKRAYRRAAAANHPDRGGNPERMVLVNQAYQVLSDRTPSDVHEHLDRGPRSMPSVEAFRRYVGFRSRNTQPLDRYVVGVAAALAVFAWIAGIIDAFNNFNALRSWIVLGLPLSYVVILFPVRVASRVGIHVCRLGVRLRHRFDAIRAAH